MFAHAIGFLFGLSLVAFIESNSRSRVLCCLAKHARDEWKVDSKIRKSAICVGLFRLAFLLEVEIF